MRTVIALACTSLLIGCVEVPEDEDDILVDRTEQASICGSTDDSQHVNSYDGTLGPSVAFVATHRTSKGALESSATDSSSAKYCSGSLISSNWFLTAGHCVDQSSVGDFVAFDYELAAGGGSMLAQTHVRITAIVENSRRGLDYAILQLEGNPGATWGISPVAAGDAPIGSAITIIGHPNGEPKQIEAGTVAGFTKNYLQYGNVDTLPGSSGSGVLNAAGEVVGVHTNGGCTATGGTNSGVRISQIRKVSNVL